MLRTARPRRSDSHRHLDGCVQQGRIYFGSTIKGVSAVLKCRRYVFVSVPNLDVRLLHAHVDLRDDGAVRPSVRNPLPRSPERGTGWRQPSTPLGATAAYEKHFH